MYEGYFYAWMGAMAAAAFVGLVIGFIIGWCGCAWLIAKKVPSSSSEDEGLYGREE